LTELVSTDAPGPNDADWKEHDAYHGTGKIPAALAGTSRLNSCENVVHIDFKRRTA
jgi:hypothetical protein